MSNKKTVLAAAVALAVVAYAGTTWYTGQRAQASYQAGVAELRKLLGDSAVVTDEYHKGFFSSKAHLVLEWKPGTTAADAAAADAAASDAAAASGGPAPAEGDAPAAKLLRLAVDTSVSHGPLAGAQLAAAVTQSRFYFEGLDDKASQALAKATGPTLTSVHHFLGGNDVRLVLPAGEIGDKDTTVRWQEMVLDMAISRGKERIKGTWNWPELALIGVPGKPEPQAVAQLEESDEEVGGEEEEDGVQAAEADAEAAPAAVERTTVTFSGMESRFDNQLIDGLWTLGAGTASLRFARLGISSVPAEGGETKTLLDLKDLVGTAVTESDGKTLGGTTQLKGAGRIGPLEFDAVGYEQKMQRLDIEAMRNIQRLVVDGYRAHGLAKAPEMMQSQIMAAMQENAPRLVAALPAYSLKLEATFQGQTGHLEYGAEVKSAPTPEQAAAAGWMPALLKTSALHANASLPKGWLEPLLKARSGGAEVQPGEVDAMLGMAQATGYARIEGDHLTSAFKMQDGQVTLNGKPIALPMGMMP